VEPFSRDDLIAAERRYAERCRREAAELEAWDPECPRAALLRLDADLSEACAADVASRSRTGNAEYEARASSR